MYVQDRKGGEERAINQANLRFMTLKKKNEGKIQKELSGQVADNPKNLLNCQ